MTTTKQATKLIFSIKQIATAIRTKQLSNFPLKQIATAMSIVMTDSRIRQVKVRVAPARSLRFENHSNPVDLQHYKQTEVQKRVK